MFEKDSRMATSDEAMTSPGAAAPKLGMFLHIAGVLVRCLSDGTVPECWNWGVAVADDAELIYFWPFVCCYAGMVHCRLF